MDYKHNLDIYKHIYVQEDDNWKKKKHQSFSLWSFGKVRNWKSLKSWTIAGLVRSGEVIRDTERERESESESHVASRQRQNTRVFVAMTTLGQHTEVARHHASRRKSSLRNPMPLCPHSRYPYGRREWTYTQRENRRLYWRGEPPHQHKKRKKKKMNDKMKRNDRK